MILLAYFSLLLSCCPLISLAFLPTSRTTNFRNKIVAHVLAETTVIPLTEFGIFSAALYYYIGVANTQYEDLKAKYLELQSSTNASVAKTTDFSQDMKDALKAYQALYTAVELKLESILASKSSGPDQADFLKSVQELKSLQEELAATKDNLSVLSKTFTSKISEVDSELSNYRSETMENLKKIKSLTETEKEEIQRNILMNQQYLNSSLFAEIESLRQLVADQSMNRISVIQSPIITDQLPVLSTETSSVSVIDNNNDNNNKVSTELLSELIDLKKQAEQLSATQVQLTNEIVKLIPLQNALDNALLAINTLETSVKSNVLKQQELLLGKDIKIEELSKEVSSITKQLEDIQEIRKNILELRQVTASYAASKDAIEMKLQQMANAYEKQTDLKINGLFTQLKANSDALEAAQTKLQLSAIDLAKKLEDMGTRTDSRMSAIESSVQSTNMDVDDSLEAMSQQQKTALEELKRALDGVNGNTQSQLKLLQGYVDKVSDSVTTSRDGILLEVGKVERALKNAIAVAETELNGRINDATQDTKAEIDAARLSARNELESKSAIVQQELLELIRTQASDLNRMIAEESTSRLNNENKFQTIFQAELDNVKKELQSNTLALKDDLTSTSTSLDKKIFGVEDGVRRLAVSTNSNIDYLKGTVEMRYAALQKELQSSTINLDEKIDILDDSVESRVEAVLERRSLRAKIGRAFGVVGSVLLSPVRGVKGLVHKSRDAVNAVLSSDEEEEDEGDDNKEDYPEIILNTNNDKEKNNNNNINISNEVSNMSVQEIKQRRGIFLRLINSLSFFPNTIQNLKGNSKTVVSDAKESNKNEVKERKRLFYSKDNADGVNDQLPNTV